MDTSKFLKQIRAIIREEIEYALDKKITEIIKSSSTAKPLRETSKTNSIGLKKQSSTIASNKLKSSLPSKTGKKLSSGEVSSLQDILNETRRSMEAAMNDGQQLDYGVGDEYQEMRYDSNSLNSFTGNPLAAMAAEHGIQSRYIAEMDGEYDPSIPVNPAVQKALTRDYSALVAKMNTKT